jgi:hypothetical protein
MTNRSKTTLNGLKRKEGKPKLTTQGNSKRSKPRGTRKLRKGQGK